VPAFVAAVKDEPLRALPSDKPIEQLEGEASGSARSRGRAAPASDMSKRHSIPWSRVVAAALTCVLGCGGGAGASRAGGDGASGGNPTGTGSLASGAGGTIGATGGPGGIGAGGSTPGACQESMFTWTPKTPTVFVLVDRSGSMFTPLPETGLSAWTPLKDAVLEVIQQKQGEVRFGFGAFTGEVGQTCPIFDQVAASLANYDAIAAVYNRLGQPAKGETPTMRVLPTVKDALQNDPTDGPKFILLVTDGQPDYCADGNELCPVDAVVRQLQLLATESINTFVLGLKSPLTTISDATLQAFANAGAGQPVVPPAPVADIFNQCYYGGDMNAVGWKADHAALGLAINETLGAYASVGGTATVFKPNATDKALLVADIGRAVSSAKSCIFDLTGKIQVDLALLRLAHVYIEGQEVPLDDNHGWRMNTSTQLELVGDACNLWRLPASVDIRFEFPCSIIVPR